MKIPRPIGPRVIVIDDVVSLGLEERAKRVGLALVIDDKNKPRPTSGRVMAVGSDPLTQEEVKIGDTVFFDWHAGKQIILEGQEFRSLELQELISVDSPKSSEQPEG